MNGEQLIASALSKIACWVRVSGCLARDEVRFTPSEEYLMVCHPERKLRVKRLPAANNSMLVSIGNGREGNSAIVVYHEGELHWYFFGTSGEITQRIWSLGWRPNRKNKVVNPSEIEVLKNLYL